MSDTAAAELNLPNSPVGDDPVKGVGAVGEEEQMKQKWREGEMPADRCRHGWERRQNAAGEIYQRRRR